MGKPICYGPRTICEAAPRPLPFKRTVDLWLLRRGLDIKSTPCHMTVHPGADGTLGRLRSSRCGAAAKAHCHHEGNADPPHLQHLGLRSMVRQRHDGGDNTSNGRLGARHHRPCRWDGKRTASPVSMGWEGDGIARVGGWEGGMVAELQGVFASWCGPVGNPASHSRSPLVSCLDYAPEHDFVSVR